MSMSVQHSFNSPVGTLHAFYSAAQQKPAQQKLDRFTFENAGHTTEVALSKVWINGCPAIYLKGFKSIPLAQETIEFTLSQESCEITLQSPKLTSIDIRVKVAGSEQTLEFRVLENLKITGLKQIIAKKFEIKDAASLNLKHEGYLLDGSNTLKNSGFQSGTELTLTIPGNEEENTFVEEKLTDGFLELEGGFASFTFVKPDTDKILQFSKEAPKWRRVGHGLNLKGECTTKTCKAFQQVIYIKKGMGIFQMAKECCEITCPECKTPSTKEPTNFGFTTCTYSIDGMMEDRTKFVQENKIAPKDAFLTFEEVVGGVSKMSKWRYLDITTTPSK